MVPVVGFELTTYRLQGDCNYHCAKPALSTYYIVIVYNMSSEFGAEYQNRTDDGRLEIYSFTIKLIPHKKCTNRKSESFQSIDQANTAMLVLASYRRPFQASTNLAEVVGFEPTEQLPAQRISNPPP